MLVHPVASATPEQIERDRARARADVFGAAE
jgi:hypothetical protein